MFETHNNLRQGLAKPKQKMILKILKTVLIYSKKSSCSGEYKRDIKRTFNEVIKEYKETQGNILYKPGNSKTLVLKMMLCIGKMLTQSLGTIILLK